MLKHTERENLITRKVLLKQRERKPDHQEDVAETQREREKT